MNLSVNINEDIKVGIYPQLKKQKGSLTHGGIYLHFTLSQKGITQSTTDISTGITIAETEWTNKEAKGKSPNAQLINNKLNEYMRIADIQLNAFSSENANNGNLITCSLVRNEIFTNVKTKITGKAPNGQKAELTTLFKTYTVDAVVTSFLDYKKQVPNRQRQIKHAISILHRYFNRSITQPQKVSATTPLITRNTPLITNISKKNLQDFKIWFDKTYRTAKGEAPKQDTTTTWFSMIASVFKYAYKEMEILRVLPLPDKFRGSFADNERVVMSEFECMQIINLDETTLSRTQIIAKNCLVLQLTTGMGYGDMQNLSHERLEYDNTEKRWRIKKGRNKTGTKFTSFLSSKAKDTLDKLMNLVPSETLLFDLPSLDYTNRQYKIITTKAGVKTHVTTYILRHSFSVDYMNNDGRIEDLAKVLGNTPKQASVYGRISDKRLADKNKQLESKSLMHQLHQIQPLLKAV